MTTDLILFTIGMVMALFVSLSGMLLAYLTYNRRKHENDSLKTVIRDEEL